MTFKDNQKKLAENLPVEHIEARCGQCVGCRLTKAKGWAVRCVHEAQDHEENSFITLTYDPEHLPENGSLNVEDWQQFMKRLRFAIAPKKIRFYMCGEYGEDLGAHNDIGRPHFHAIIFGHAFTDDRQIKRENPHKAYQSETLEKAWGKGITELSDMTLETAAYVARYTVKKITGDLADDHYMRINKRTGECHKIRPEFSTMSRRPGIGKNWYQRHNKELDKGFVTVNGAKQSIPQFYKTIMSEEKAEELDRIQQHALMNLKKQDRWNLEAQERQIEKSTRSFNR